MENDFGISANIIHIRTSDGEEGITDYPIAGISGHEIDITGGGM